MTEEGAALRPQAIVETSIQEISATTAGKIFVAVSVETPGEVRFGMAVDGIEVAPFDNKKEGATYLNPSIGRYESYAFDLPMRIIGQENQKFPADHSIVLFWGKPDLKHVGWQGKSEFTLRLTGKSPVVKYNPKTDSD
jgi:hypothetical protein